MRYDVIMLRCLDTYLGRVRANSSIEYEHSLVSIPPEINTAFEVEEDDDEEAAEAVDEDERLSEDIPSMVQWHTASAHTS